ncbi:MAG: hypothetical protein H8E57_05030 [Candidatus Cloacimonetes bacterium]|nr:hypothetical protein [Candidatus Cloacimonadota bacterium]
MNKRKLFLCILVIFSFYVIHGIFEVFPQNQAHFAERTHSTLHIPLLNNSFNFSNSILNMNDLQIFTKDHFITSEEKKILTGDDLKFQINFKSDILHFGAKNLDVSFKTFLYGKGKLLESKYAKLVLYGNEQDAYTSNSGENTEGIGFSKLNVVYSLKKAKNIKNIPFNVGVNLALYFPSFYGNVPISRQKFGSTYDASYYKYRLHYYYTEGYPKTKVGIGLGFGMKAKIPKGNIYLSLDDIFANLTYKDMKKFKYEKEYVDSLLYFDTDHEAFEEHLEVDSIRFDETVYLLPSIEIGVDYKLSDTFSLYLKFNHSEYSYPNGFSLTVGHGADSNYPLFVTIGKDENIYTEFKAGYNYKSYELMFGLTYFDGFFNGSKGVGFQTGLVKKLY